MQRGLTARLANWAPPSGTPLRPPTAAKDIGTRGFEGTQRDSRKAWAKVAWIGGLEVVRWLVACTSSSRSPGVNHHCGLDEGAEGGESLFRRRLQDKHAANERISCAVGPQGRKQSDPSIESNPAGNKWNVVLHLLLSVECRLIDVRPHRSRTELEMRLEASDHGALLQGRKRTPLDENRASQWALPSAA